MTEQVSKMEGQTPNSQMGLIGYIIAAGVALILLPVSPFLLVLWLATGMGGESE
ncbi:DUF7535 family protein [Halorussus lipolyticus]|uniref:DUF7535 family protein n=1 Tax=Halorussus lipolyticus TaxID=3034024 RepID=UPI0023E8196A|nr:hypothetical protein [Halorussus sp. DT80]